MIFDHDLVKKNSAEIERLRRRIDETCRVRSRSRMDRDAWSQACVDFHGAFGELAFPGGEPMWSSFIAGEHAGIEAAIVFLEADPYFFRSGYLKQQLWHRLKRFPLTGEQSLRVEAVALGYLRKPTLCEFWRMVRYVRRCGSAQLWGVVNSLAADESAPESPKAYWLTLARLNFPIRTWVGDEFSRARYKPGHVPQFRPEVDSKGRLIKK